MPMFHFSLWGCSMNIFGCSGITVCVVCVVSWVCGVWCVVCVVWCVVCGVWCVCGGLGPTTPPSVLYSHFSTFTSQLHSLLNSHFSTVTSLLLFLNSNFSNPTSQLSLLNFNCNLILTTCPSSLSFSNLIYCLRIFFFYAPTIIESK
jgi:hypothetical protein